MLAKTIFPVFRQLAHEVVLRAAVSPDANDAGDILAWLIMRQGFLSLTANTYHCERVHRQRHPGIAHGTGKFRLVGPTVTLPTQADSLRYITRAASTVRESNPR